MAGVAVQDQALEWLHRRLTADARRAESYMFFLGGYTLVAFFRRELDRTRRLSRNMMAVAAI